MKNIIFLCRLTCASCLHRLVTYGSEIDWDMRFKFGLEVGMVLGEPVGSSLVYSVNMLIGLALGNYFGTWEGSLVEA